VVLFNRTSLNKKQNTIGIAKIKLSQFSEISMYKNKHIEILKPEYLNKADSFTFHRGIIGIMIIDVITEESSTLSTTVENVGETANFFSFFFTDDFLRIHRIVKDLFLTLQKGTLMCKISWLIGLLSAEVHSTAYYKSLNKADDNGYVYFTKEEKEEILLALHYTVAAFAGSLPVWGIPRIREMKEIKNKRRRTILEQLDIPEENFLLDYHENTNDLSFIAFLDTRSRLVISFKGTTNSNEAFYDLNGAYEDYSEMEGDEDREGDEGESREGGSREGEGRESRESREGESRERENEMEGESKESEGDERERDETRNCKPNGNCEQSNERERKQNDQNKQNHSNKQNQNKQNHSNKQNGYVHSGIKNLCQKFYSGQWPSLKARALEENVHKVLLTGHSLGGAAAILASLLIQRDPSFSVEVLAFSPPPLFSRSFSTQSYPMIRTYVYGADLVPRINFGSILDFKYVCISTSSFFDYISDREKIIEKINDVRRFLRERVLYPKLYQIGELHHILNFGTPSKPDYRYKKVEASFFEEILCVKGAFFDHFIHKIRNALNSKEGEL